MPSFQPKLIVESDEAPKWPQGKVVPYGYCHCGCGEKTTIANHTDGNRGIYKGKPNRFIKTHGHRESIEERFWKYARVDGSMIRPELGNCWRWIGKKNDSGYGLLGDSRTKPGAFVRAHRVSYEMFRGPIPEGLIIRHSCDNPECCNPLHLGVGTHKDNMLDAFARGRAPVGSDTVMAKLSDDQIREMRRKYAYREVLTRRITDTDGNVATLQSIADEYGIETTTVLNIILGRSWKHLLVN